MADTLAQHKPFIADGGHGGGIIDAAGSGDPGGGHPHGASRRAYRTGMWFSMLGICMFFLAFTSSYIVRSGLSDDWVPVAIPSLMWWTTLLLIASSLTMEKTRRALSSGHRAELNQWLGATLLLGFGFLVGQVAVWRELASRGVFLTTNPSSSFFYLLTASHGIHLLGGVLALLYIAREAWLYRLGPAKRTLVEVTAMYWHFMDGLWVYILMLLWLWR
ncbi:MAG: hypothetical protein A3F68_09260 [Acidobacteria bacterium RIFCSPLOWO2_12_FULL_54_10]|nr:MAG: hypothetical protein A3F68_09260 [Acidobacteria bacterium RIFCSPLOWO2_12_FULL_54_10]